MNGSACIFRILCVLAAILICYGCDVSESGGDRNFVSLLVPDSLGKYDDVRILLLNPGSADTLDTLWTGPVTDSVSLKKLPTKRYTGGMVDVVIQGKQGDSVVYLVLIQYRGAGEIPAMVGLPLPFKEPINVDPIKRGEKDTIPPWIILSGLESPSMRIGEDLPDLGAVCEDNVDRALTTVVSGTVEASKAGRYELVYGCEDKSGNAAIRVTRTIWVMRPPDTTRPVIALRGRDSITVFQGSDYIDSGSACADDRDTGLAVQVEGVVDTRARGETLLRFQCADSAANRAFEKVRYVQVARVPDTLKPILSFRGPDSITVFQGSAYTDSGSACVDERDGVLPVSLKGTVDAGRRGDYDLVFSCADSAGNAAAERIRRVSVIRAPDPDKPILTLRGADSLMVHQGAVYADSGADCRDARDGALPVQVRGTVDTEARGLQELRFECADSAGNAAVGKVRRVLVARKPDPIKPILILRGADSLTVYDHETYEDSGAACGDDRDGELPVSVTGAVDVSIRGLYSLAFHCQDSAGNPADALRKVRVVRRPDALKPVLRLRGPDSLVIFQGAAYADSGAECHDDRDGALPVALIGSVDATVRGIHALGYHCADSAGNAADALRKVSVVRVPDTSKPVITLRGSERIRIPQGRVYADSGADCADGRDGNLPVTVAGTVGSGMADYVLKYGCADSAGNAADTAARVVSVVPDVDVDPPAIILAGEDTIPLVSLASYREPGGVCKDAKDGILPLNGTGITPPGTAPGWYRVGYACRDSAGNEATATRILKIGLFGTSLGSMADAQIDTLSETLNFGGTGPVCMVVEPNGNYFTLIRFDMSKVVKSGLKAAKLRLYSFGHGNPWPGANADYTFQVHRVKSDWVEGTGNWFYHEEGLKNGGETWLEHYPMSEWGKSNSSHHGMETGIRGADKDLVRESNLDLVATRKLNLFFSDRNGSFSQVPPPDHLTVVELDITGYVQSADPAADYGFVIKVFGVPAGRYMDFATRDLGDGSWAPRLMLEY